jgi:hypothetical protein
MLNKRFLPEVLMTIEKPIFLFIAPCVPALVLGINAHLRKALKKPDSRKSFLLPCFFGILNFFRLQV